MSSSSQGLITQEGRTEVTDDCMRAADVRPQTVQLQTFCIIHATRSFITNVLHHWVKHFPCPHVYWSAQKFFFNGNTFNSCGDITHLSLPSLKTNLWHINIFALSSYANAPPPNLASRLNTHLGGQLKCVSAESMKVSPGLSGLGLMMQRFTLKSAAISPFFLFLGGW